MNKNFAVIGGDLRINYLAQMLAKNNKVYLFGQKIIDQSANINLVPCNTLEEAIKNVQIVISSVPLTKDGINVYAPFSNNLITITDLIQKSSNKTLIAGSIKEDIYNKAINNNIKLIDLMEQEDLTILNTIATAEGAICDIILNTSKNIHGSKILVLGFGRVAKVLAIKLSALNAKITCAARKDKDFAWMESLGFESTNINHLKENLGDYDVIVNTVPKQILDSTKLNYVKKDCLLLDLASKPGGIDKIACEDLGLKFIWSLAIPGKIAPVTSAHYIKNTIDKIIKEGEDN